jgi:hypothetical protein
MEGLEEEEEAELGSVSTLSFIQANLQHSIAASRITSRMVMVTGIDMALIQEPWYRKGRIIGLNTPGYTLFHASGTNRPRACILTMNETAWMLPGFLSRDLVAVLIKYKERGAERCLVVCSAYLPYDSEDPPPSKELKELVKYCENENLYLVVGCNSNAHHSTWGSTDCNSRGEVLMEFLNSSNLEILNRGSEPTFCSGSRLEVTDITLGTFRLLESITDWKVSSEPSLSDHTHILFNLRGSVPVRLIRNPRGTNWGSFKGDLQDQLERGPEMNVNDEAKLGLAIIWIQQALVSAYKDNCPLRPVRTGRKSLRWTMKLELLIKIKRLHTGRQKKEMLKEQ